MGAVYNLVEGEDVEATEAKLAAYQRENYESIVQNDARKVGVNVRFVTRRNMRDAC